MKETIILTFLLLFSALASGQISENSQVGKKKELDLVLKLLEESTSEITKNHIVSILDSLDQVKAKDLSQKKELPRINENGDTVYSLGDLAQGGIVFWVDKSGRHGLVVPAEDQAAAVTFHEGKTSALTGDSVYAGKHNTEQIIANRSVGYHAALVCSRYRGGGYDDWYLPSKFELRLLYNHYRKNTVKNFARDYYWSSSEDTGDFAWLLRFYDGQYYNYVKYGSTAFRVRAVRAF